MATPVPRQCHTAHGGSTETSGGTGGGAGFGYLHKSSCPGRPAAPLGARHVGGGRLPGSCPLSPSPVPCPPPAVQPRGVPSRRRVSQLSSAASEQRRVLDNTPAGRGGLAGVESPRGGKKTHQKNKKKKQKKLSRGWNQSRVRVRWWHGVGGLQLLGLPRAPWGQAVGMGAAPTPAAPRSLNPGSHQELLPPCPERGQEVARHLRGDLGCWDTGSAPRRGTCARRRHLGARRPW